jgi:hypothetical protein
MSRLSKDLSIVFIAAFAGIGTGLVYEAVKPKEPAAPAQGAMPPPQSHIVSSESSSSSGGPQAGDREESHGHPAACQAQEEALHETEKRIEDLQSQINHLIDSAENSKGRCAELCKHYQNQIKGLQQLQVLQHSSLTSCRGLRLDEQGPKGSEDGSRPVREHPVSS